MKNYLLPFLVGLIVAAIWGFFSDLQNGEVGWFIGRLVFTPLACVGLFRVFGGRSTTVKKAGAA